MPNTANDLSNELIVNHLNSLHHDVSEIRSSFQEGMREMSSALTKLVELEQKNISTNANIERTLKVAEKAHSRLDAMQSEKDACAKDLENRLDELEKHQQMNTQTNKWVSNAVWAAAGLALMYAAKAVGLM